MAGGPDCSQTLGLQFDGRFDNPHDSPAMNKDGVSAAFELIIEEINAVAADIAVQGSKAFHDQAYDAAQQLGNSGKSLQAFRKRVEELLEGWQGGIDINTRQRFAVVKPKLEPKTISSHTKAPKTRIKVKFPDGTLIEEYYAADTFALALRKFGLRRVETLGLTVAGLPLVGDAQSTEYGQRIIDGRYICTQSSSQSKKEMLEKVGKSLGITVAVEIIKPV